MSAARFVEPMLLRPTPSLPASAAWVYELKLDGFRAEARKVKIFEGAETMGDILTRSTVTSCCFRFGCFSQIIRSARNRDWIQADRVFDHSANLKATEDQHVEGPLQK